MNNSFLSSFTPSLMSSEALEAIFVQRHKLAHDLIELIRDSSLSQCNHFCLLIGMRGIGKTHTIALIYHRLKAQKDLQNKLLIAWLKEEEWGVSSWLDLLMRIFQALAIEYPTEYQQETQAKVESLYEMAPDDAMRQGEIILKEFVRDRTLLLLAENLDEIFKGLKEIGQKQLRAYIQNQNFITIVATSQILFDGVEKKDAAFYGFFATEYLDKLSIEEATSLLTKIAQLQKDLELESFIQAPTGKDRIKAIHHLAGGNHRVYIIFSQFLTRNSLDELVKPVMQTLDELTPYYQSRMQWLSPQQRKIIEFLCDHRNAVPVKEIAQRCFISHQTASGQLKDLRTKGYVTTESLGRASFYELQEPLMRICLEVKKQRGKPIKLFVDFLIIWYTEEELTQRLEILPEECLEREYINHALDLLAEYNQCIHYRKKSDINNLLSAGIEELEKGNYKSSLQLFNKATEIAPNNDLSWYSCGIVLDKLEKHEEAIDSHNKALAINSAYYQSWHARGVSLSKLERYEEAIDSYNKALAINSAYCQSWHARGISLSKLKRYEESVNSYNKALTINSNYYYSWYDRGISLYLLERHEEAIDSYNNALKMNSNHYCSWNNIGCALYLLGRYQEAIDSYNKALEINPNSSNSHFNIIEVLFKLDRWEEGFIYLEKNLDRFANSQYFHKANIAEYIKIIWESTTDPNAWKSRLKNLVKTYNKHQLFLLISKGVVNNIPNIMSEFISIKAARSWLEIWQEIAGDKPELQIALRFLKTAVEYKENPRDRKVLLQLPKEERSLLESLLK
ncbi:MAG: tetratricopeptide repeat protein [Cyanobacteria bacterium P01_F01_bin.143]